MELTVAAAVYILPAGYSHPEFSELLPVINMPDNFLEQPSSRLDINCQNLSSLKLGNQRLYSFEVRINGGVVKEGVGKIIKIGRGNTRYLTIPMVAKDENFPFKDNEAVRVRIEGGKLVVERIEWSNSFGSLQRGTKFLEKLLKC